MSEQHRPDQARESWSPPVKVDFKPVSWADEREGVLSKPKSPPISPKTIPPNANLPPPGTFPPSEELHGFARPPSDFDIEKAKAAFLKAHGTRVSQPSGAMEESVEDEIARKTAELEEVRNALMTDTEKARIADRVQVLRDRGWLEGLKLQLVNMNTVPIEYFNRLVAEHEQTIVKVAQINSAAERGGAHENKELNNARQRIMELETKCQSYEDKVQALQDTAKTLRDNQRPLKAEGPDLKPLWDELEMVKARVADLQTPNSELRARCDKLRQERDMYRAKWARRVLDSDTSLTEFWEMVENTDQHIKELYEGIRKLGRMLSLDDGVVLDTPQVLDEIAKQVTALMNNKPLRKPLLSPKAAAEFLQVLDRESAKWDAALAEFIAAGKAARAKEAARAEKAAQSEKPCQPEKPSQLETTLENKKEPQRRVTARTPAYGEHRKLLLNDISNAKSKFLELADKSVDGDEIGALVEEFIQPAVDLIRDQMQPADQSVNRKGH